MRRHLPRLLVTGALLSPVTLYALGLGEIRLTSALNQPFNAEIELISPTTEELESLEVSLAGSELFSRYGIDRPAFLSGFDFSVNRARDGRAHIKVTSNRSVTEPFVTLLVEASWARGRLVREYTVLLDPPVFMPSQTETPAAPVATPQSGAQTDGRIVRQPPPPPAQPEAPTEPAEPPAPAQAVEEPTAEPVAEAPAARTPVAAGGTYTVERNDTLWRIASDVNPGPIRVVNQTMIALYRANPEAFGGNINRLRAGSVLRVPELAEIESISTRDASAEVARQAAEWSGAQLADSSEEANRLRLVTPEETPAAPSAASPSAEQSTPARPDAAAAGAPGREDRRLEVTSPDLAGVQRGVDETRAQPEPEASDAQPATGEPAAPAPAEALAEETTEPAPPARAPAPPVAEETGPSLGERIAQFWWVPVVLGLLVVVGLVLAFIRRRREESGAALDSIAPLHFEPRVERAPAPAAARGRDLPRRDREETFVVESGRDAVDDFEAPVAPVAARRSESPQRSESPRTRPVEPVEPLVAAKAADDTLSSETAVRFDQQDALAEADFHMAYGLYDQAADLVKIAIEREPGRRELRLKLLEIYFVWGNKDLFLDTARDLHGTRGEAAPGEWDKVLIMGKQIAPEDPMFKGEAGAAHVDLVDVNLEGGENRVDVDLFAEPDADRPAGLDLEFISGERRGPTRPADDADLDFMLNESGDADRDGADDEPTRELDPLARTQETPTVESPTLDRSSQTVREKIDLSAFARSGEQTEELSIDDLGLDVDALENTGSLEDTTSLEKDPSETGRAAPIRDDEMTQLAPSLSSFERTMEAPRVEEPDTESTGTIYIDQVDLAAGGDTIEQQRPDVDSTAAMQRLGNSAEELDVDLDDLSGTAAREGHDTVRQPRQGDAESERFSSDVFAERTSEVPRMDLDVGEPLSYEDHEPTNKQITNEMELSELEPVTMSEVGTKLDLARAYMDMGDPDGARSILEEVQAEGDPQQKQEAQRLLDSIR